MRLTLRSLLELLTASYLSDSSSDSLCLSSLCLTMSSNNNAEGAVWDPEQQIYVGGIVPNHNEDVDEYLNQDTLRIFGYGSLCWNPGTGALAREGVTTKLGRAIGYKRCWAQKSTDHRGTPLFPGIVCTLLKDEEVREISTNRHQPNGEDKPSMTEGVVYYIPDDQAQDCLAELDFREKGGYARDVVEVVEYDTGNRVKALLYRGTPDNPAFWERALLDLPFASAVMSVSIGPSGKNSDYLFNLDNFMTDPKVATPSHVLKDFHGDTDTDLLAVMAKKFQTQRLYFLFGCGSNQHNQLLLSSAHNDACLDNDEEAREVKEIVLCTGPYSETKVKQLVAGGGHSGLLTEAGELFLWGWNDSFQLGRKEVAQDSNSPLPVTPKLGLAVSKVALGFSHSLIIEKGTGRLFAFGSNDRGQVNDSDSSPSVDSPLLRYPDQCFVDISAGLFHSAAITDDGELVTFGCSRFGQVLSSPWKPSDKSRLVQVACGRRHTLVLDEHGRVWAMGENKRGQLGRLMTEISSSPQLVEGFLGEKGSGCFQIDCGWSHCVAAVKTDDGMDLIGWGRNDKGQLGLGVTGDIFSPTPLPRDVRIHSFSCGSESLVVVDTNQRLWGCGWNEHGNLGTGNNVDLLRLKPVTGARIVAPPPTLECREILLAAGGAHVLAMLNQG